MATNLEADGKALHRGRVGEWNRFVISTLQEDVEDALANILVAFDGPAKPDIKFNYEAERVVVLYRPSTPGKYTLSITKSGESIAGSPFKCQMDINRASISIYPDRIKVYGKGLTNGKKDVVNEVFVEFGDANIRGKLKVSMEGPTFPMLKYGKPEIHLVEVDEGLRKIQYKPKFAGKFKLHLEFDEIKVPGSPFLIVIGDENGVTNGK